MQRYTAEMPRTPAQRLQARLFDRAFEALAGAVRRPVLRSVVPRALFAAGRLVGRARDLHPSADIGAIARGWQRTMPNPKVVPITEIRGDTAYAEIRVACPLRGTGDLEGCHRMMAYDRGLLARTGTRFVVLESQAAPGVERCRVALRALALPTHDLRDARAIGP